MKDFENFYDYGSFDEYDVVRIPYKISHEYDQNLSSSRRFSMVIILPKARIGLPKLIEKFQESPHPLTSQHLKMKNELITCLSIPRFKLSYNFIPLDDMQELGLTLPFDFNDELDGLIEDNDHAVSLKVSRIIRHIQVECNEKGTEVIACTYDSDDDMGFSLESPPPPKRITRFIADHPFIFMIKEDVSDYIFPWRHIQSSG
ncbi:serpin-Z1-like [Chenopodium quinoa]|uniref:serpin-Z1-like n=1 Tax=Chenopodium quinoa TaxID=63459 RepID=UPI000B78AE18|nr:serpin-Z1-like [Chenopodium quinoa]